ncbi:hypothetical protein [Morganella psychrotolerans]|uniref:hypothetical protein n=1 Tax=Morganella psychrotolerans TaxID=368603 RepID=UPI000A945F91|nr:hypothetical protein [Morganella psychrotolerans]
MSQYSNHENLKQSEKGIKTQLFELITFSAGMGGDVTSVDGGEMGGGILGSSYDQ